MLSSGGFVLSIWPQIVEYQSVWWSPPDHFKPLKTDTKNSPNIRLSKYLPTITYFQFHALYYPLPTTFHLLLTTYYLSFTTFNLLLITYPCHLPLTTCSDHLCLLPVAHCLPTDQPACVPTYLPSYPLTTCYLLPTTN